jgi:hypothetical protein
LNLSAVVTELQELGLAVEEWQGQRWEIGSSYGLQFSSISKQLFEIFPTGGGGQEKLMSTTEQLPYVVKIAGDPEYQHWQNGMQSLFEEYQASRFSLNGYSVMAESHLLWHESGAPMLIQEKLVNLTNRVSEKLAEELEWLPKGWRSYAQIGQTATGEWRIYDLDAGTSCDFYPETQWDEVMNTLLESYYRRGEA